ncbi:IclR family transcriptional regulator [Limibacillus halophilus]|nr:IclR family transcriptional regulator [Limibacillus halophilus]
MTVLDCVAQQGGVSTVHIAEQTGLPPPTAHRICSELERLGHLQRVPGSRNWMVSRPLVDLSARVLASAAMTTAADAVLTSLTREIGEMTSFGVQVADHVVYLASAEAPQELTLSFRAGRKAPLFCTSSGRLFLARLKGDELEAYLEASERPSYTPYTVTDKASLRRAIEQVRTEGYAITCQEYLLHVAGAAVPVVGDHGLFLGALSVAAPDVRTSAEKLLEIVPHLQNASELFAKCLKGHCRR